MIYQWPAGDYYGYAYSWITSPSTDPLVLYPANSNLRYYYHSSDLIQEYMDAGLTTPLNKTLVHTFAMNVGNNRMITYNQNIVLFSSPPLFPFLSPLPSPLSPLLNSFFLIIFYSCQLPSLESQIKMVNPSFCQMMEWISILLQFQVMLLQVAIFLTLLLLASVLLTLLASVRGNSNQSVFFFFTKFCSLNVSLFSEKYNKFQALVEDKIDNLLDDSLSFNQILYNKVFNHCFSFTFLSESFD